MGCVVCALLGSQEMTTLADQPLAKVEKLAAAKAPTPEKKEVATVTAWHRVDWAKGHAITKKSPRIKAGQKVALKSGLVEITFDNGAKAVIEGPAEFIVDVEGEEKDVDPEKPRDARIYLKFGRIVGRSDSPKSGRLTIDSPAATIIDLGAEFGVEVGLDGEAAVSVFAGEAEVVTEAKDDRPAQRLRLKKKEAASVPAKDGKITRKESADQLQKQRSYERLLEKIDSKKKER